MYRYAGRKRRNKVKVNSILLIGFENHKKKKKWFFIEHFIFRDDHDEKRSSDIFKRKLSI